MKVKGDERRAVTGRQGWTLIYFELLKDMTNHTGLQLHAFNFWYRWLAAV